MPTTQPLPPKKEVALALLERSSVYIHLDPRQTAVMVPSGYKKQPQLVLQVGMNMPVPIPDLRVDDSGVSCTLSFNRTPFFCVIPWASVFAMIGDDGRGMVWPDDVPSEVRQSQGRPVESAPRKEGPKPAPAPAPEAKADAAKPKRPRKRPPLAAVPNGDGGRVGKPGKVAEGRPVPQPRPFVAPAPASRPAGHAGKKREIPPYLRVVK
ncbi:MAG TPA: ClpXP protease specificity-enhancing factor SspB [Polyangiaceae bacterium]|nr:ClpXP protease specificity-enhancing factor SspB [Polyangiaceae bacterium]